MAPNEPPPKTEEEILEEEMQEMAAEAMFLMKYPDLSPRTRQLITAHAWLMKWHQDRTTRN